MSLRLSCAALTCLLSYCRVGSSYAKTLWATQEEKKNASAENFTTKFWLQCLDVFTGMPDYLCPTFCLLPRPSFLLLFSFVLRLRKCWRDVSHGVKLSLPTNDVAAVLIECFEFNRQR